MAAETVAYVASRSSALSRALRPGQPARGRRSARRAGRRLAPRPSLALFLRALATKEEAAAVPLLLLLLDFFFVAGQQVERA